MSTGAKFIFGVTVCGIFSYQHLTTQAAFAQLSANDIDNLRERGRCEGWIFIVGETPATRRPLPNSQAFIKPEYHLARAALSPRPAVSELPEAFD